MFNKTMEIVVCLILFIPMVASIIFVVFKNKCTCGARVFDFDKCPKCHRPANFNLRHNKKDK